MSVSFNGYKNNVITFETDGCALGYPVDLGSSGKVTNATNGCDFIGICTAINGNYVSVQTDGYIEMKYSGTAPSYGLSGLVCAEGGKVNGADATAKAKTYLIVKVDKTNKIVGFIL
jgi:hypothetical protein